MLTPHHSSRLWDSNESKRHQSSFYLNVDPFHQLLLDILEFAIIHNGSKCLIPGI